MRPTLVQSKEAERRVDDDVHSRLWSKAGTLRCLETRAAIVGYALKATIEGSFTACWQGCSPASETAVSGAHPIPSVPQVPPRRDHPVIIAHTLPLLRG